MSDVKKWTKFSTVGLAILSTVSLANAAPFIAGPDLGPPQRLAPAAAPVSAAETARYAAGQPLGPPQRIARPRRPAPARFSAGPSLDPRNNIQARAPAGASLPRHDPSRELLAGGPDVSTSSFSFRTSGAGGFRYIGDVMDGDDWGGTFRFSLSPIWHNPNGLYYGVNAGVNAAWASRFNSVNDPSLTDLIPVGMYNSPSVDILPFIGYRGASHIGFEVGFGPQIAWIKWRNSPQQSNSGVRVVPKVRGAVTFGIAKRTDIFVAVSHTFNTYSNLRCNSGAINCFNDDGYVAVTDFMLGISRYFK